MKRYFRTTGMIIFLSMMLFSCKSESPVSVNDLTSSYTPSDSAKMYFLPDAMEFAVEYLFQTKSPDTSKVVPPDSILNKYLLPLARLYDARDEIPSLDTLIGWKHMWKRYNSSVCLQLEVDTSYSWVKNVFKGIFPTGNSTVDSIAKLYNISFSSVPILNQMFQICILTDWKPMNYYALEKKFNLVGGVISSEPCFYDFYDSDIKVIPSVKADTVQLCLGYGNPVNSEYPQYKCWTYYIDKNFKVIYLGSTIQ